jgi:hypothetical protein
MLVLVLRFGAQEMRDVGSEENGSEGDALGYYGNLTNVKSGEEVWVHLMVFTYILPHSNNRKVLQLPSDQIVFPLQR